MGILKSGDGGQSWTILGQSTFPGLVVTSIVVHPTNPNIVFAANGIAWDLGPDLGDAGRLRVDQRRQ